MCTNIQNQIFTTGIFREFKDHPFKTIINKSGIASKFLLIPHFD